MYSELECGICYQIYNSGRRCPRELHCKHSFCESCLAALSRPQGADSDLGQVRLIVCPLCRHITSISGQMKMRAALKVDECVLERLVAAGVLEEDGDGQGEAEERPLPDSQAERSDAAPGSTAGRIRRSLKRVWGRIARQRGGADCMTSADMRDLAMMSCYMI
ncbi:RING finger protein 227 isoform X2 [Myripristis murdjan]|uniref:RING finger protein 227 isoform X2 n=1 Tax=Myripristis murdjan TaxID=586833 RepID=UPI001175F45A|nr:RING finger protein 227-like isoform X2 [Myripristis murdjan]